MLSPLFSGVRLREPIYGGVSKRVIAPLTIDNKEGDETLDKFLAGFNLAFPSDVEVDSLDLRIMYDPTADDSISLMNPLNIHVLKPLVEGEVIPDQEREVAFYPDLRSIDSSNAFAGVANLIQQWDEPDDASDQQALQNAFDRTLAEHISFLEKQLETLGYEHIKDEHDQTIKQRPPSGQRVETELKGLRELQAGQQKRSLMLVG